MYDWYESDATRGKCDGARTELKLIWENPPKSGMRGPRLRGIISSIVENPIYGGRPNLRKYTRIIRLSLYVV